ncbi:MAG TPA: glycosyltransferase family A protein [Candidatus Magasanikbacteria bacterium]|nr:glycosyltransferase family A protein [Candidatus Magasanikbacteria bacterium]
MELISVIVPVYNRRDVFLKSLTSLISQTYSSLQIIIVDDGSTEDIQTTFESVCALYENEQRSFLCIRQENRGAPAARNRGLREAVGTYVIFWDADVIADPHMLQTMYDTLQKNTNASFAYSNFLFGRKLFRGMSFSFEELKKKNYITTTSLIKTEDAVEWDESLKRFQDWDLWLTMAESGKSGIWIDKTLFKVEKGGTISSWLPSFAYNKPFRWLPGMYGRVKKYENAERVIFDKHHL